MISTHGKVLPQEGLDHLLLSIGFSGVYGGQTSVTGTNIRTHFVGLYGDLFTKAISSPYEILKELGEVDDGITAKDAISKIDDLVSFPENLISYLFGTSRRIGDKYGYSNYFPSNGFY